MPVSKEQFYADLERIMISNPVLHLATVPTDGGRPHSSAVWTAPDEAAYNLYWLSSPERTHSIHIAQHETAGHHAPVSGSMHLPVRPSMQVLGLSFEGEARRLTRASEITNAIGILTAYAVFNPTEVEEYMNPDQDSMMPRHAVYEAQVMEWTHFDGSKEYQDRKTRLAFFGDQKDDEPRDPHSNLPTHVENKSLMDQDVELSARVRNQLKRAGVADLNKLIGLTEAQVLSTPWLGKAALNEIRDMLSAHGLRLKTEDH